MASLNIALRSQESQTELNVRRREELLNDPELARFEGRIETDRHGHIIMRPPAAASHGGMQAGDCLPPAHADPERTSVDRVPVKAADVAWASQQCVRELGSRGCFPKAPDICVEVLSPGNTDAEISEKMALYFDARATEVWICGMAGNMQFTRRRIGLRRTPPVCVRNSRRA